MALHVVRKYQCTGGFHEEMAARINIKNMILKEMFVEYYC
jgi:hypothetical protein